MSPTPQQIRTAATIDQFVREIDRKGGGDVMLLENMIYQMSAFKTLLDSCEGDQLDQLCSQFVGFYRYAKLLEQMAQAIQDGRIDPAEF